MAFAFILVVGCTLAVLAHRFEPFLRARIVEGLQDHFHTRVELDDFHVEPGNGLRGNWGIWATGRGLRIWPPERTGGDHPLEVATQSLPLIELREFRFHVPLRYKADRPVTISLVRLNGMDIHVPPRSERDRNTGIDSAMGGRKLPQKTGGPAASSDSSIPANSQSGSAGVLSSVVVERVECEGVRLEMETDKPDKLPLTFVIAHLQLRNVSADKSMEYTAELTNPKPTGLIHTTGKFGPWFIDDPGQTPVEGTYRFDNADLATFKGIAGILHSTGTYHGTLRDIVADGEADVPDFRLTHFGNTLPLHTRFHARIDGTNGDTRLDSVDATLGHSHFSTNGQIVRVGRVPSTGVVQISQQEGPHPPQGHDINLKVDVDRGRMEDFLHLASRTPTPLLMGALTLTATLHIPPGKEPVHQRIRLDGVFKLDQAHFTSEKIQNRIRELSLRGQGHPGDVKTTDANSIASTMQGEFHMADAVIVMPSLNYDVPGAAIKLTGKYDIDGFMNFSGSARMQATVSQMVGGWKGFLLKPADRFFKKDGAGTMVLIQIKGPHDQPDFSVNFPGSKHTSPEAPGQKLQ